VLDHEAAALHRDVVAKPGNNTDLKTHDYTDPANPVPLFSSAQLNYIKMIWMDLAGGPKKLIEHKVGGTVRAHLHLVY
jgi:hypothetical protein